MSKYCEVKTEFKNEAALIAAMMEATPKWTREMIEVHQEPQHLIGYTGDTRAQTAHIIVRRQHVQDAANDLGNVLAESDADQKVLDLVERIIGAQALCISGQLPHRLDVGCKPGEAMRRALFAIKQAPNDMAFHHHALAHFCRRIGQECVEDRARFACEVHQIVILGGTGGGNRHQGLAGGA